MRGLLTILCMCGSVSALAAEPVVLPEFSFDSSANFALSVMLQTQLEEKLTEQGHIVLTHDMVVREVGQDAVDRCIDVRDCPGAILPRLPSQIAVVARLERDGGDLIGHVEIWEQSRATAMEVRDFVIKPGEESLFVDEVANATTALVDKLPPSPPEVLMSAARMIAGLPAIGGPPVPAPTPLPQPVSPYPQPVSPYPQPVSPYPQPVSPYPQPVSPYPQPVSPYPQPASPYPQPVGPSPQPIGPNVPSAVGRIDYAVTGVDKAIEGTPVRRRHLMGARNNLRKSGMDPRSWLYKRTPHAGRLIVEPRVGIGIGDVARGADVRISVFDGLQRTDDDWFQEGPLVSNGVRGGLYVGFAPVTVLDLGVLGGIQYGKRRFSSGIYGEQAGVGQLTLGGEFVNALQFVIQPRLRVYVVPFGPIKPFLYAAGDFRFFSSWKVGGSFPQPPGGTVPGAAGGGGILIDPSPIVGFYVEGGYIRHFGPRAAAAQNHNRWIYDDPTPPQGSFGTTTIVGGVQFRL